MAQSALGKHGEFHITDLPFEVLVDIFLSLPVKSLGQAKCTCKLWHTIIGDPEFIEMQFNCAVKNPGHIYSFDDSNPNIYFVETVSSSSSYDDDIEATKISARLSGLRLLDEDIVRLSRCYSTGGLLAYISKYEKCCDIYNPIIKEKIKVPLMSMAGRYEFGLNVRMDWWGFGYSSSTKEYKIILFASPLSESNYLLHRRGGIHTLGSESWRDIPYVPIHPDHRRCVVDCGGTLFWFLSHDAGSNIVFPGEDVVIGSLVIASEEFQGLRGPYSEISSELMRGGGDDDEDDDDDDDDDNNDYVNVELDLIKMGDTVACVRKWWEGKIHYSIWTLRNKINEIWVNEYNFELPYSIIPRVSHFTGLWMNRDLLAYSSNVRSSSSFVLRQGKRYNVSYTYGGSVTYDTNSREFRELSLPFCENSDGCPRRKDAFFVHVGCLISPRQILNSYSGDGKPLFMDNDDDDDDAYSFAYVSK